MKTFLKSAIVSTGLLVSAVVGAAPVPGTVVITPDPNYPNYVTLQGQMNVGTNPKTGHTASYFQVATSFGKTTTVRGYDAVSGRSFSCWSDANKPAGSDIYTVASNVGEGASVFIRMDTSTGYCIYMSNASSSHYSN